MSAIGCESVDTLSETETEGSDTTDAAASTCSVSRRIRFGHVAPSSACSPRARVGSASNAAEADRELGFASFGVALELAALGWDDCDLDGWLVCAEMEMGFSLSESSGYTSSSSDFKVFKSSSCTSINQILINQSILLLNLNIFRPYKNPKY